WGSRPANMRVPSDPGRPAPRRLARAGFRHPRTASTRQDVDGRDKHGHDEARAKTPSKIVRIHRG
ncbi:hypothetical protein, partial [Proteus mirabilis]|uniref:hypothetical protein n=1 Tax=Proteus mirabilis TaxID=584 RepID=UPI001954AC75